jgi:hypothetical protein
MDPSVQKIFIREAFNLPNTETGAKIAEGLLPKVFENLSEMDSSVNEYLESNNYFITSPKKYDPDFDFLASSMSRSRKIKEAINKKLITDDLFKKQLLLAKNVFFTDLSFQKIFSKKTQRINIDLIKTLILEGFTEDILYYY